MSVSSELTTLVNNRLTRLSSARSGIAAAIRRKGVSVSSSAGFEDFEDLIDEIEQGGGDTPAPSGDTLIWTTTLSFTSAVTGTSTLVTQTELVNAGIIPSATSKISDVWSRFYLELLFVGSTHSTNMIIKSTVCDGYKYSSSGTYYKEQIYHSTSASSVSAGRSANNINTSTTGYMHQDTTNSTTSNRGIRFTGSNTSNKLAANSTYRLTFIGIEK